MNLSELKFKKLALNGVLIVAGFLVGAIGVGYIGRDGTSCDTEKFKLLNKKIICVPPPVIEKHDYVSFKSDMEKFIQNKNKSGEVQEVAVYFRDLQNGPIMGINEDIKFTPASLLKVPLLFAYLGLEEKTPGILDKKISYRKKISAELFIQRFAPKERLKENEPYSIKEFLRHLIVYSDNDAYGVLGAHLKKISPERDIYRETILELGIIDPKESNEQFITVKSYASLFRALYNATYFEQKETSEYALSLLAQADFRLGLVAGVPESIVVAHKFGERFDNSGRQLQLHDCGIIYYPDNPYLLCIMTRGGDFQKLTEVISNISGMTYKEVNSRRLR